MHAWLMLYSSNAVLLYTQPDRMDVRWGWVGGWVGESVCVWGCSWEWGSEVIGHCCQLILRLDLIAPTVHRTMLQRPVFNTVSGGQAAGHSALCSLWLPDSVAMSTNVTYQQTVHFPVKLYAHTDRVCCMPIER